MFEARFGIIEVVRDEVRAKVLPEGEGTGGAERKTKQAGDFYLKGLENMELITRRQKNSGRMAIKPPATKL